MKIKRTADLQIMDTPHKVDARNLFNNENCVISIISLMPGESLKKHITPVDVAFYVLEGTGIIEIGEEKEQVTAECLIESPQDIAHCWYNNSDKLLRFLIIKAPKPTRMTIFLD